MEREVQELKSMASLYRKRGRARLAIEILKTAASMQLSMHGAKSQQLALTMYELGECYCDEGRFKEAQPYFEKAASIWQDNHPNDTQQIMAYTDAMLRLQDELEKEESARAEEEDERGESAA